MDRQKTEDYSACRTLGHSWDQVPTNPGRRRPGEVELQLLCVRCTTVRTDRVERQTGRVLGRSYSHPEGYAHERRSRDDWRLDYMRALRLVGRRR